MRVILVTILGFLVSCSTVGPVRKIASVEAVFSEIDFKKSVVQIFPPVESEGSLKYFFYIQLKSADGKFSDASPMDIALKDKSGKVHDYTVDRILPGRFYVSLKKTHGVSTSHLDFFVKGKALKEQVKLSMSTPDRSHSSIKVVGSDDHRLTLQLRLADKNNRAVALPDHPEIILEGLGTIENLSHVSEGVWEFSIVYPEENQIMYMSVRAMGIRLHNIFRYQHVEK